MFFFETAKYAKIPHIRKSWGEFSVANQALIEIGLALEEKWASPRRKMGEPITANGLTLEENQTEPIQKFPLSVPENLFV